MAKSKPKMVKRVKVRSVKSKVQRTRTNPFADEYKRILLDPCNAPLPTSPYNGADGSQVVRSTNVFNNGDVFSVVAYHPIYGSYSFNVANIATAQSFTVVGGDAIAVGGRAIAGCLSATWVGAESNRQGLLYCGVVPGTVVWSYLAASAGGNGGSISPAQLAAKIVNYERMPVDKCEVNWFPGEGDSDFQLPVFNSIAQVQSMEAAFAKTHFCIIMSTQAAIGSVSFKTVGVSELGNNLAGGLAAFTVGSSTEPKYDWREALADLSRRDTRWFIGAFRKAGMFVSGMAGSYLTAGLPGALGYLTQSIAGATTSSRSRVRSNV